MEYSTHQLIPKDHKSLFGSSSPHPYSMFCAAVFFLAVTFAQAAVNGPCTAGSAPGVCLTTSSCSSSGGTSHAGFCPSDPTDVQCCTKVCGSGGICRFSNTCSGTTQSGAFRPPHECRATISIRRTLPWTKHFPLLFIGIELRRSSSERRHCEPHQAV